MRCINSDARGIVASKAKTAAMGISGIVGEGIGEFEGFGMVNVWVLLQSLSVITWELTNSGKKEILSL